MILRLAEPPRVRIHLVFCALGSAVLVLLATHVARAQPASDPAPSPSVTVAPSVDITVCGLQADGDALRESLQEMLRRLGLELRLTVVAQFTAAEPWQSVAPEVVVRAWIDARQPDGVLVTLSDRRSGHTGVARLVPRRGSHGLLLEETALVVHAETESLLSEPAPAAPVPDAAVAHEVLEKKPFSDFPAAVHAPRGAPNWVIDATTFVEDQYFAEDTSPVFGVGAGGQVHWGHSPWYPGLWLIGAYHFEFGQSQLPVQLNADVWSARLVPTLRTTGKHLLALEGGLGGGVDVFAISPGATVGVSQLEAKRTDASAILTALAALHLAASPTVRFTLGATLDWDLHPRRYVAASGSSRDVLIRTLPFRPGLTLGMSFEVARSGVAQ